MIGVLALVYALLELLARSPWGRVLKSIRDDEAVSVALGKNSFSYKVQCLALGSAIAALSGSLLAFYLQYINPNNFLPLETFYAWIMVILGGSGNNRGTILGAIPALGLLQRDPLFRGISNIQPLCNQRRENGDHRPDSHRTDDVPAPGIARRKEELAIGR